MDLRSIWEYDKALGSAIKHYCEYTMAAQEMEKHESFLFWFNVSASNRLEELLIGVVFCVDV